MGGKLPLVLLVSAILVIGGGIAVIGKLGGEPEGLADLVSVNEEGGSPGRYADDPLEPTATFNVSRRLESGVNLIPDVARLIGDLNSEETDPESDLEAVDQVIQFHAQLFKTVPSGGENVDIMRKLTGGNERRVALIDPDCPHLNERGELVDRWGTPFHFHQLSSKELEIRSAGEDRALYTEDDILLD
ncbi:MAG: hypothetical protein AAGA96_15605 [Verrucomicrobiota bacterium]